MTSRRDSFSSREAAADDALTAVYNVTITGGHVTTYVDGKAVNCFGTVSIAAGTLDEK